MLIQSCRGKALRIVRAAERHNGLLAWRRLHQEYKPKTGGRHNAMFIGLLSPSFPNNTSFDESLSAWEVVVEEYERETGEVVTSRTRIAVITRYAPDSCRALVLQASAQAGTDYEVFKSQLLSSDCPEDL